MPPDAGELLQAFAEGLPYRLDDFQQRACRSVEQGHGVLVCAPTGAGKTVVGEFAVQRAIATGGRCFYTTPIKALSNQKFTDLIAQHGARNVGLLTGDVSVNSGAPVVVMTTEVLRNMLYAGSGDLRGLTAVVLDEVHYLADKFRGAVWEEVILQLPMTVQVVGLSATVSNAEEFGAWLQQVRGDTDIIVDEHRPVPLWQHMMVGRRIYDLFAGTGETPETGGARARIDPALARAVHDAELRFPPPGARRGGFRGPHFRPPSRVEVIERLDGSGLLPAITFIFSRAGCEAALAQCVRSGLRLVNDDQRRHILQLVDDRMKELPEADLDILGFYPWREALSRGFAAHHAGLLPVFKETVEKLFAGGYLKAVFATETLALGINMPARTVVLEKLVKYNGESHVDLTPGEYTQLTGRAGRRGIDIEGHAVVLWSPGLDPHTVAGLASRRTYPLRSSFAPSYNMAVNLIARMSRTEAKDLLLQSFAQFQADAAIVGLARQVVLTEKSVSAQAAQLECECGDVVAYLDLLDQATAAERGAAKSGAARRRENSERAVAGLRRGDVIQLSSGRRAGLAVVLDQGVSTDGQPRPLVITASAWSGRLGEVDLRGEVQVRGTLRLPKHVNHRTPQTRKDIASAIRALGLPDRPARARRDGVDDRQINALRKTIRGHPVHGCARRDEHIQAGRRWRRQDAELTAMRAKVESSRTSLGEQLDRILTLLTELGYICDDRLTEPGRQLARIWSESDLLICQALHAGIWEGLPAADLAAAVSAVVYESRKEPTSPQLRVGGPAGAAITATRELWTDLSSRERELRLRITREPDAGFAAAVRLWAHGGELSEALAAAETPDLLPGDFVRWCRQVVDVLDQLRQVAPDDVAANATAAIAAIRRGVVALGNT